MKGFTFFESYYNASKALTNSAERLAYFDAINQYAFDDIQPDLSGFPVAEAMFSLIKPHLDVSKSKAIAGAKKGNEDINTKSICNQGLRYEIQNKDSNPIENKNLGLEEEENKNKNEIGNKNKNKNKKVTSPVDHSPVDHSPVDHSPVDHSPVDHSPVNHSPVDHSHGEVVEVVDVGIQTIVDAWDSLGLNQVQSVKVGTKRYTLTLELIQNHSLDEILQTIDMVGESDFLMGKVKQFTASFDWFIDEDHFEKIQSGNYANRVERSSNGFYQMLKDGDFDDD